MASQTVNHLMEAMKCLSSNEKFKPILSNMLSKSHSYDTFAYSSVNSTTHCQACGINFTDVLPKQYLLPGKKCNRFLRRQLKYEQYSTKYQMHSLSKVNKNIKLKRILVKKCQSCGKEYKTKINKPNNVLTSKVDRKNIAKKQKKKKPKQKNREVCGLKQTAVSSAKKGTKRKRFDSEVILIDSPNTSVNKLDSIQNENEIIELVDTPKPKKRKSVNNDVILLDTPKNIINENVIVIEDTPNSPAKKNNNKKSNNFENAKSWRYFSDQNTEKNYKASPKSKKKKSKSPNVVLASAKKHKQKKLNTLSDILGNKSNNIEVNKPVSNLKHFLKSIV